MSIYLLFNNAGKFVLSLAMFFAAVTLSAQDFRSMTVADFLEIYQQEATEEPVLYNFWASWCGPCVKELPYFESLHDDAEQTEVKVVLVSLDFAEARLQTFLENRPLISEVIFLTDWSGADEEWIPTVHPEWSGAIPITVFQTLSSDTKAAQLDAFEDEAELRSWLSAQLAN
ncbi:MAG: TlpA disulfide reductase family protein [Bacteroidota bacterium]